MITCVLAEKPSQARDFYLPLLEKVSGEKLKNLGEYYISPSFILSWFYGHLLVAKEPFEYDPKFKEWRLEDLPIVPDVLEYRYKDASSNNRGVILVKLCNQADMVICATDPDREGEGIFRTFWNFEKISKPAKRLWAVSLADDDLLVSWNKMKEISHYDALSKARDARASADWLVGMNVSRAYSCIAYTKVPIGRVLTATLAIIVARDHEVESFRELCTYQLKANWNGIPFVLYNENGNVFERKDEVDKICENIKNNIFSLFDFTDETKTEYPPKTFNLPDLQKEANKAFGFALDKTLNIAQSLYEKKLITYPRTDSTFLPESDLKKYYVLIEKLSSDTEKKYIPTDSRKPPCVKDSDSAHTALIPTTVVPNNLSEEESLVYELIRSRFVSAFMYPRIYHQYTISISDEQNNKLKARVTCDIEMGYKNMRKGKQSDTEKDDKEEEVSELSMKLEEEVLKNKPDKLNYLVTHTRKKTRPKYHTAGTLISAMQNCGSLLEDEVDRQTLKEVRGIGTPATQATYPINLEKYGYIKTEKKYFISTPKGRSLIASIQPDLKTPKLTAEWEFKLKQMELGKYDFSVFDKEIKSYVTNIVSNCREHGKTQVRILKGNEEISSLLPCPTCGRYLHQFDWGWACVRDCGFKIGKNIAGHLVTTEEVRDICVKGITQRIEDFTSKEGKTFFARLTNQDKKIIFDFNYPHPCPRCFSILKEGSEIISCSKCNLSIKKTINAKVLTDKQIESLICKGKSPLIKGFLKNLNSTETFDAYLVFNTQYQIRFQKK